MGGPEDVREMMMAFTREKCGDTLDTAWMDMHCRCHRFLASRAKASPDDYAR